MFKLVSLGFIIWGVFRPEVASYSFIGLIVFFEGWMLSLRLLKPNLSLIKKKYNLKSNEVEIYNKYKTFYNFPNTSSKVSEIISGFQISVFIWVPLLLYNRLWLQAIVIGLNYFLAMYLSKRLKPLHFAHLAKANSKMALEKDHIKSVYEKVVWGNLNYEKEIDK
jgi:hypothetical protein